jgi:hypothetical protein
MRASDPWNLAYLLPGEVVEARERLGLVILPLAPVEWYGPHLAMGRDPLLATAFARRLAEETSMLAASYPDCVGLSRLPAEGPLRNTDYGVVDGDTFDGSPTPDHTLREEQDPRCHSDPARGRHLIEEAAREVVEQVRRELLAGP